ncbi:MAG TPA: stage II sporulation protein M [Planctomycetota bacterium]
MDEARTSRAGGDDLARLRRLLAGGRPLARWSGEELLALTPLYRRACTHLARLEQEGEAPERTAELRALVAAAHARLFAREERTSLPWSARALAFLLVDGPRAVRAEKRLLALAFAFFYGLVLASWLGVSRDLDLAYSLLAPAMVEQELEQLAAVAEGEPFRGNFTFGLGESPTTAGRILLHNIGIGVLFFASGLLPPIFALLLATNGLMVGTYTAVAGHFGQAGAISSILWTHGMLELQALVLAGAAGLVLVRAWIRPGVHTRGQAMLRESRRALELFLPVVPMLVVAGLIEGFVSPHAPPGVRLTVAGASALALVGWGALGTRILPLRLGSV